MKRSLIIITFLFVFSIGIIAQTTPTQSASLIDPVNGLSQDESVKFALANNGELAAMRKEAEASRKRVEQAAQRARPSIGADGLQQTVGKSYRYTVKGTVPLELGGRRRTRIVSAQRQSDVKEWAVVKFETEIAAKVRSKHATALALVYKLELVEELLASIENTHALVKERVKEGKTAPLEEKMVLVELNRVRAKREIAERNARVEIIELETLIGRDSVIQLKLRGSQIDSLNNLIPTSELERRALTGRPDLMLLRSMEDLAEAKIDSTKSLNRFDASASLGYQRLRISETVKFNYLVFGINFKLPTKDRGRAEFEAAVIDKVAMEKRLAFGELVVKQEVRRSVVRYSSAVRSREISRNGVVAEATKNLDVVRQMYELGAYSLLEYLAEQRRVIELRKQLVESDLEVALSGIEVDRATNAPELVTR